MTPACEGTGPDGVHCQTPSVTSSAAARALPRAQRERPVTIPGPGPALEAALAIPAGARLGVAVCHPHPLYGGDMDSPIVTVAVQACAEAGLATLRFNFRGVGGSAGAWGEGGGEQDDVRAALAHLRGQLPADGRVALAGYSFGASMAAAVASAGERLAALPLIAPPLA